MEELKKKIQGWMASSSRQCRADNAMGIQRNRNWWEVEGKEGGKGRRWEKNNFNHGWIRSEGLQVVMSLRWWKGLEGRVKLLLFLYLIFVAATEVRGQTSLEERRIPAVSCQITPGRSGWGGQYTHWRVCGSQDFEWPKSACSITYREHVLVGLILSLHF